MDKRMKELLSKVGRTIPDYEGLTDEQMMNIMREEDIQGILPHNMDYLRDGADETSLENAMNLIELRRLIGGVGDDNVEYMQSSNAIKRLMEGLGLPLKKMNNEKVFDITWNVMKGVYDRKCVGCGLNTDVDNCDSCGKPVGLCCAKFSSDMTSMKCPNCR